MINSSIGVVLVALSTVNTAVIVGLGFFHRPSRASALWAFAFSLAMITSYGWVAADAQGSVTLRAACAAVMVGSTVFIWAGLRVRRGVQATSELIAVVFTLVCAVAMSATAGTPAFPLVFRAVFVAAAVFAALTLTELVRLGPRWRHETLPLAVASAGFIIFGAIAVVDGVIQVVHPPVGGPADGLELLRDLNSMASIVYGTAAVISLLLLTRADTPASSTPVAQTPFRAVAEDRLRRAQAAGDRWWCVLEIRLDDPVDLREAFSAGEFARIADRFARDVSAVLPPDADLERQGDDTVVVLLPRPEGAVRPLLSRLLDQVATPDPTQPLAARVSASIGWASVDTVGYDLDELLHAAHAAAMQARRSGGDRWERVMTTIDSATP
ncbi:diguanylate cyclase [Microbacterium sp. Sa4CUA7]|uniref:Diguanylate cyclase n=1 Tax=Microbacterium pullorum TaxID=2762236 RepID=A0ABR8S5V5_9MICO|nr:diguanylate cyclase [Microbacterium pullorum]MBD7958835.1 diguanylate cyclase [Microbacterium pullorum]